MSTMTSILPTVQFRMENIRASLARLAAYPEPEFNCVVCTRSQWDALQPQLSAAHQVTPGFEMLGLPVWIGETGAEALELLATLQARGKKPLVLKAQP